MKLKHPAEINILFDDGGLGDNVARLPVLKYIYENYPDMKVNAFVHDYFVPVMKNFLEDKLDRITVYHWSVAKKYYNQALPTKSLRQAAFSNLSMQMTEHAFAVVCNTLPSAKDLNYPILNLEQTDISKFDLPDNYIVITTAFTAAVREFLPVHVNKIVAELKSKGENIVFLGASSTQTGMSHVIEGKLSEEVDFSQGLNLIDKTTLLEATKILGNAKCVVGLDNGLLHLAACTEVPVVSGFTSVNPEHRMAYRKNVKGWNWFNAIPEDLACKFCQSKCVFTGGQDFRICQLGTYNCIKDLTAEIYLEQIYKALEGK